MHSIIDEGKQTLSLHSLEICNSHVSTLETVTTTTRAHVPSQKHPCLSCQLQACQYHSAASFASRNKGSRALGRLEILSLNNAMATARLAPQTAHSAEARVRTGLWWQSDEASSSSDTHSESENSKTRMHCGQLMIYDFETALTIQSVGENGTVYNMSKTLGKSGGVSPYTRPNDLTSPEWEMRRRHTLHSNKVVLEAQTLATRGGQKGWAGGEKFESLFGIRNT